MDFISFFSKSNVTLEHEFKVLQDFNSRDTTTHIVILLQAII